jgi:glycosyltransferase involved in cell wall biosynthesis
LRVLLIHDAGDPGLPSGESVVVARDAAGLRASGVEVVVEAPAGAGLSWRRAPRMLVELFWSQRAYERTRALIDELAPDVVHAHGVLPRLSASVFWAARSRGVATVQTLHNFRWFCVEGGLVRDGEYCDDCVGTLGGPGVRARCARGSALQSLALAANNLAHVRTGQLARAVDRFVAVSEFARRRHIEAGFPADRIVVRDNIVPCPHPAAVARRDRSVCFAGRLDRGKGADLLPALAAELPDHSFAIAGSGPLEGELRRRLGPAALLGRLDHDAVYAAMARAQVVVVPSRATESSPLVVAEAMACATPVVVSDRGALPSIIARSGGGLVAAPSAEALAAAIRRITASRELAEALGRNGRSFVERELAPDIGTRRLLDIYRAAIDR